MRIPDREHEIVLDFYDETDLWLEKLHRNQSPDKFTALAASLGWVEEELPPNLITEVMNRIKMEKGEENLNSKVFYVVGGFLVLVVFVLSFLVSKVFNPKVCIENSQTQAGLFWLVASLALSISLFTGVLISYRERAEESNDALMVRGARR